MASNKFANTSKISRVSRVSKVSISELSDEKELNEELAFQIDRLAASLTEVFVLINNLPEKLEKLNRLLEADITFMENWCDFLHKGAEFVKNAQTE